MAEGKYFMLHSQQTEELVLDVEHGGTEACSHVLTQNVTGADSQLWYWDILAGTIRNKLTEFVLDYDFDKNVIVNSFQANNRDQIWRFAEDTLFNEPNDKVLDIAGASTDSGVYVVGWDRNDGPSQKWTPRYQPAEFFFLKNKMNGDVLDLSGAKEETGVPLVTWAKKKKEYDNQLWYEDHQGLLRTKIGNFVIDDSEPECIESAEYDPLSLAHVWVFTEGKIVNGPSNLETVLEVKGRALQKRRNGAKVGSCQDQGAKAESEQRWVRVYDTEDEK